VGPKLGPLRPHEWAIMNGACDTGPLLRRWYRDNRQYSAQASPGADAGEAMGASSACCRAEKLGWSA
jgi:hypothetical protein